MGDQHRSGEGQNASLDPSPMSEKLLASLSTVPRTLATVSARLLQALLKEQGKSSL